MLNFLIDDEVQEVHGGGVIYQISSDKTGKDLATVEAPLNTLSVFGKVQAKIGDIPGVSIVPIGITM